MVGHAVGQPVVAVELFALRIAECLLLSVDLGSP
jgi:hypothetical protein